MDGKYVLSSGFQESRLFDINTMEVLFDRDVRFVGLFSQNRLCSGVIQDGFYSKWKLELLTEYTNDRRIIDRISENEGNIDEF